MKPHHGKIRNLTADEAANLLERNQFGHLACHTGEELYVVPITYMFEGGYLYGHAKNGKKIQMMRHNPRVCVQVEEIEDFFHWKSVIAWGRFEELKPGDAGRVMQKMVKKFSVGEEPSSDIEIYFESMTESAIIYRIKIERMTGRREGTESAGIAV